MSSSPIVISKGLAWVIGIALMVILGLAVPWAASMQSNASTMATTLSVLAERQRSDAEAAMERHESAQLAAARRETDLRNLIRAVNAHVTDPGIHTARLNVIDGKVEALRERIALLERRIERLESNGKAPP